MKHIIINKKLSVQKFDIPKVLPSNYELLLKKNEEKIKKGEKEIPISLVLPNNLKKICDYFSLSANEIAKALDVKTNFIIDVINQNSNFSGKSIIKFIKQFNIPFNLLYNINSEISYDEETRSLYGCIIKTDSEENVSNSELIEYFFSNSESSYDYEVKLLKKINSDSTIDLTTEDKKNNYKYHLELIKQLISDTDCSEGNYHILVYYKIEKQSVTKFINLQEHIDLNLINYLDNKPFFKYGITYTKITEDKYLSYDEDNFKLDQTYDFLINNEIVNTDIINKKLCTIKENCIIIPVCHFKKILLNKLKDLREYKKLSIHEMADILCISSDTYISIEKGHQKLSPYVMWKLEKEFGILLKNVLNIDEYYKFCCEN